MALEMDWTPDFCLSCDRQISQSGHGAYCSQACRLSDLERASSGYESSRPSSVSSWTSSSNSGFYLPPALNFSAMSLRNNSTSSASSTPTSRSPLSSTPPALSSQYNPPSYLYGSGASPLPSSPSRSSIYSETQYDGQQRLSDEVEAKLHDYASSFDQIRDLKRRRTVV